jgi:hypothetical protein
VARCSERQCETFAADSLARHACAGVPERFQVIPELAAQDKALHERVDRLLNFRNVRFPRLLQVHAEGSGQNRILWVVSEHIGGQRLSSLLSFVGSHPTLWSTLTRRSRWPGRFCRRLPSCTTPAA